MPTFRSNHRLANYDFSVRCHDAELAAALEALAGCRVDDRTADAEVFELRPHRSDGGRVELLLGTTCLARGSIETIVDRLIWEASTRAFRTDAFLFVHAGVVSLEGRGVMLPGPAEHGKSTTVAGLVRSGFDFLSDEAAAIDPADGTVHPFPRPLSLSPASLLALDGDAARIEPLGDRDRHLSPDDLRAGSLGTSCPISFIVAPAYGAHVATTIEPMSRSETLRLLVEQTFNLDRLGGSGFRLLADVVRQAECFRLTISALPAAVEAVQTLFERVSV